MDDKRKTQRKELQYLGLIVAEGQPIRQCVIANASVAGAKLVVRDVETLPSQFKLMWSEAARTGSDCQVRWRHPEAVGVQFIRGIS